MQLPNNPSQTSRTRAGSSGLTTILTASVLGLVSVALLSQPSAQAVNGNDPNLVKLENKFFQHDYGKDDMPSRLERLEKMVFGETKTGTDDQRLKNLVAAVPNLNSTADDTGSGGGSGNNTASSGGSSASGSGNNGGGRRQPPPSQVAEESSEPIADSSNYPAVSAMEKRVFGKDFAGEPITKRLDRLEVKAFGKSNPGAELIDRVDRLRSSTGVDLARQAPAGSDWADEDETYQAPKTSYGQPLPYSPDADGKTFSGRNLRKDFADAGLYSPPPSTPGTYGAGGAYTSGNSYSPPGTYGAGGGGRPTFGGPKTAYGGSSGYGNPYNGSRSATSGGAAGGSGYGAGIGGGKTYGSTGAGSGAGATTGVPRSAVGGSAGNDGMPRTAPDIVRGGAAGYPGGMGLSQQVSLLEREVFQRTFQSETIPARLDRLEKTMYPNQSPSTGAPIPSRVARLMQDVQPSDPLAQNQKRVNPLDNDDLDDMNALANNGGMPPTAPPMGRSGLSKVINGLSNFFGGGMTGGYGTGGTLMRDPSTGLLIDPMSGNLIDPTTGVVVGTRGLPGTVGVPGQLGGFGQQSFGSFGSGMSPMGGYGVGGVGSNGIRFGFGGAGTRFGPGMILP